MNTIIQGDCLEMLRTLPESSVQCCVTSPPYCGLRDYGVAGQLGLEKTPEEYVAKMVEVFREVRRVLREDGTCWVNLGDSYAANGVSGLAIKGDSSTLVGAANHAHTAQRKKVPAGLKPKDLVGIPWRVAFALQQPYYTGTIKDERDRIWLAAMIDAEGCMFIHKRNAGSDSGARFTRKDGSEAKYLRTQDTYGAGLEVANCHESIVERCLSITGMGSICSQSPEQNNRRKQKIFRWNLRTSVCREIIREIYPYLVGKKHEARILLGCPTTGPEAVKAHAALKALHNGLEVSVDYPEPKSMFEQGWYLRQEIIWSKANPMPESVRDRCTKAHEQIFLFTKRPRYYYDAEAIKEESVTNDPRRPYGSKGSWDMDGRPEEQRHGGEQRSWNGSKFHTGKTAEHQLGRASVNRKRGEFNGKTNELPGREAFRAFTEVRNKRSVWTVPTQCYSEAHFATFPPDLIKPCILAGSKPGDTILDPFGGSGTTGMVALELGRKAILIELNPKYVELAHRRCDVTPGLALA